MPSNKKNKNETLSNLVDQVRDDVSMGEIEYGEGKKEYKFSSTNGFGFGDEYYTEEDRYTSKTFYGLVDLL